jgi:phosphoribosylglycinamide formyltransferase 1
MTQSQKTRVAILASGSGTNAQNLIRYFKNHPGIEVSLVISNNPDAYVLQRAIEEKVLAEVIPRQLWNDQTHVKQILQHHNIDFLILAGYLVLIPAWMVQQYRGKIINIHPSLLPLYGGKGMYGDRIHQAVIEAGEKESGITIHYVNEEYDKGDVIFQARCPVSPKDDADALAQKIHQLEYEHFPKVAEKVILG